MRTHSCLFYADVISCSHSGVEERYLGRLIGNCDPSQQCGVEKSSKLLEGRESFSCYSVTRECERECRKKERFDNQQPSPVLQNIRKVQRL